MLHAPGPVLLAHEDQLGVGRARGAEVSARVGHGDRIRVAAALSDVDSLHEVPRREHGIRELLALEQ